MFVTSVKLLQYIKVLSILVTLSGITGIFSKLLADTNVFSILIVVSGIIGAILKFIKFLLFSQFAWNVLYKLVTGLYVFPLSILI